MVLQELGGRGGRGGRGGAHPLQKQLSNKLRHIFQFTEQSWSKNGISLNFESSVSEFYGDRKLGFGLILQDLQGLFYLQNRTDQI